MTTKLELAKPQMAKPAMVWYNFVTGEYDWLSEAPQDLHPYLPQDGRRGATIKMYDLLVDKMDKSPLEAAKQVLTACIGDKPEEEQS